MLCQFGIILGDNSERLHRQNQIYPALYNKITGSGFTWPQITPEHVDGILNLPHYHRDPFDRLLIAQAKVSKMKFLTFDEQIKQYFIDI